MPRAELTLGELKESGFNPARAEIQVVQIRT